MSSSNIFPTYPTSSPQKRNIFRYQADMDHTCFALINHLNNTHGEEKKWLSDTNALEKEKEKATGNPSMSS